MALYQCHVPAGCRDADTRGALAEAITNRHAAVINVPTIFVKVVFTEYDPTAFYSGGRPNSVVGDQWNSACWAWTAVRRELLISYPLPGAPSPATNHIRSCVPQ